MYWGQLPYACSTSTWSPPPAAVAKVPLTRSRRRVAKSMAIRPTALAGRQAGQRVARPARRHPSR